MISSLPVNFSTQELLCCPHLLRSSLVIASYHWMTIDIVVRVLFGLSYISMQCSALLHMMYSGSVFPLLSLMAYRHGVKVHLFYLASFHCQFDLNSYWSSDFFLISLDKRFSDFVFLYSLEIKANLCFVFFLSSTYPKFMISLSLSF